MYILIFNVFCMFNVFNIYKLYIYTQAYIYVYTYIHIPMVDSRTEAVLHWTGNWVLGAEGRDQVCTLCFSRDALQSFLPWTQISPVLMGKSPKLIPSKSPKLIPAEVRRLNRDLCHLGLNLKSKRNRIVLYHSPVFLELEDEPVAPTGTIFCRETPK